MKEKWEDNFQKVFSDYERKVPDGLLDDIKREIETQVQHRTAISGVGLA